MTQTAKDLLEQMCVGADPRKEKSLRLIYNICEEQQLRGSKDYSVATIGRISQASEGPSAASIRNKTGECYRAIILAFAKSIGGKTRKMSEPQQTDVDIVLEGVADPVLRTRIGLLIAELSSTRAQLIASRHLANNTATLNLADHKNVNETIVAEGETPLIAIENKPSGFTTLEIRALKASISQDTLDHWGWNVDDAGRVLSESGQQVFAAGFVSAINKILAT